MSAWKRMDSAPRDGTHILIETADFGVVEGFWSTDVESSWPKGEKGYWISWAIEGTDRRLTCGMAPMAWRPKPKLPDWVHAEWRALAGCGT